MVKVLVIENQEHVLTALAYVLRKAGDVLATASTAPVEAVAVFNTQRDMLCRYAAARLCWP
jgi:hypothetical protein